MTVHEQIQKLDGFKVNDLVTCRTDRHPLLWKIVFIHAPKIFVGRTLHLVDLVCVDTRESSHRQHRVGMCRSNVSTGHLLHAAGRENKMGAHINEKGQWQSDKFPTTPADCVPLRVTDKTAQDLLWKYAQRRRKVDTEFSDDLEARLKTVGFEPSETENAELAALRALVIEIAQHFDPMFGYINLYRLDDREWMNKAAKVVGEDAIYPWKKKDSEGT